MIEIDGSQKSGSGTIVRDAIPFAALLGQDLHIINIRKRRGRPGLRAQHLKAIEAAAQLSEASTEGAVVGSEEILFIPQHVIKGGERRWDIGTAGSTVMLAQSLLPLALFAEKPSKYTLTGGLFQDFAPSAYHFLFVLLPLLRKMGVTAEARILRPGYVPKGGGQIEMTVWPLEAKLKPLELPSSGTLTGIRGIALSSLLQERRVSERMALECRKEMERQGYTVDIDILYDNSDKPVYSESSLQPGAALAVWAKTDLGCLIGADMAGARGRTSEHIGRAVARNLVEDLSTGATADRHLADQLIPLTALAEGQSSYIIPGTTDHVEARLWLAETILGAKASLRGNRITIDGIGHKR
jgi:RNA 3'-terminal phosphate cyclase (ATP)